MHTLRSKLLLLALAAATAPVAAACHLSSTPGTVEGAALGRVVIYRNGVAFYERRATAHDGNLTVRVPRDRVDDFLKSLTVVDPSTRKPLSVTIPRKEDYDGNSLTMTLETPDNPNAEVLMTYVTEAPAWKPSYRVVVGNNGKVMLEGWAIVDNVSGEDWKGVLVGVGASSALAFRYDLWSVHHVDRDLLAGEERFASAPPVGMSPYANSAPEELTAFDSDEVGKGGSLENTYTVEGINTTALDSPAPAETGPHGGIQGVVSEQQTGAALAGVTVIASSKGENQTAITDDRGMYRFPDLAPGTYKLTFYYGDATVEHDQVAVGKDKVTPVFERFAPGTAKGEVIQVAAKAPAIDPTSTTQGIALDKNYIKTIPVPGRTFDAALGTAAGSEADGLGTSFNSSSSIENQYGAGGSSGPSAEAQKAAAELAAHKKLSDAVGRVLKDKRDVVLEVHGRSQAEAVARGAAMRNKLVDEGVVAAHVHIATKIGASEPLRVRVLAVAPGSATDATANAAHGPISDTPVGESRFMADRPMTVKAGSSAMVAMVHGETTGGVVYLYDPVSDRGDDRFAFRAVQLDNPTGDTLEPGPVTVYGDGRFIGEGITEPVPPRASVVVPFALDKQIIVEHSGDESDRIAKLVTVERGIVTAQIQHRRTTTLTLTSRLTEPARVFLRHKLEAGWTIGEAPPKAMRVGDSKLYEVDLEPGSTQKVVIEESTPLERTMELSSPQALGMMQLYIEEPDANPALVDQLRALIVTHRDAVDLADKIETMREELTDYRVRAGELHAQLVTLKMVHTGGELMTTLRARATEISDRIQKTTIAIVDAQEQLMLDRVKFGNELADLRLTDKSPVSSR